MHKHLLRNHLPWKTTVLAEWVVTYKTGFMVLSTHSMWNMSFFLNIFVDHIFSKGCSFLICHVAFEYKLCGSDASFMFFSNKYCLIKTDLVYFLSKTFKLFGFLIFWQEAYLMKIISETCHLYYYHLYWWTINPQWYHPSSSQCLGN